MGRIVLILILLSSCADAQIKLSPKGKTKATTAAPFNSATTTADGKQGFLFIGNSTSVGITGRTTTVPANTCYEFTTNATVNYTTACNFAYQRYLSTGLKPVIIPTGLSGSYLYGDATVRHWGAGDNLLSGAITKANAFLTEQGLTKLEAIVVSLTINDASTNTNGNAPFALSLVQSQLTTFLDALAAAFPNTEIIYEAIGSSFSPIAKDRVSRIRGYWRAETEKRPYLHVGPSFMNCSSWGLYDVDGLHLTQSGYDYAGLLLNRSLNNRMYTKQARAIISNHYDELSTARKVLINDFINTIGETNYNAIDALYLFKTSHNNNIYFDWTFSNIAIPQGGTFTVNSHIETTSTSNYFRTGIDPSITWIKCSLNNWFLGVKLKDGKTAAGTLGYMFGSEDASNKIELAQHSSNYLYGYNNNNTLSNNTTFTSFADDTFYGTGSDGTKQYFNVAGTDYNPVGNAVPVALVAKEIVLGATRVNAGTITLPYNGEYSYLFLCRFNANKNLIRTSLETLIAGW